MPSQILLLICKITGCIKRKIHVLGHSLYFASNESLLPTYFSDSSESIECPQACWCSGTTSSKIAVLENKGDIPSLTADWWLNCHPGTAYTWYLNIAFNIK